MGKGFYAALLKKTKKIKHLIPVRGFAPYWMLLRGVELAVDQVMHYCLRGCNVVSVENEVGGWTYKVVLVNHMGHTKETFDGFINMIANQINRTPEPVTKTNACVFSS